MYRLPVGSGGAWSSESCSAGSWCTGWRAIQGWSLSTGHHEGACHGSRARLVPASNGLKRGKCRCVLIKQKLL